MIKIKKYHGLGNDYLVFDPNINNLNLNEKLIKKICDRHYGVGSDGLLYGPIFENDNIKVKIYNPDGSEAEKSGNGVRIFSRYLLESGYIKDKSFTLNTKGGDVEVEYVDVAGKMIKVMMGKVSFMSDVIPVTGDLRMVIDETMTFGGADYKVSCLSIGNPHCVIVMDKVSSEIANALGPIVESDNHFPNKINVQFMKIIDEDNIQIEIYERGAGYTLSSGSSSCAAASVAYRLGFINDEVTVHMPGGNLKVEIKPNDVIYMTGSVDSIGTIELSEEFIEEINIQDEN